MTEEEYWSSLPSYGSAVAPGTETTQEAARKVEMSQVWLVSSAPLLPFFFPLLFGPLLQSVTATLYPRCCSLERGPIVCCGCPVAA